MCEVNIGVKTCNLLVILYEIGFLFLDQLWLYLPLYLVLCVFRTYLFFAHVMCNRISCFYLFNYLFKQDCVYVKWIIQHNIFCGEKLLFLFTLQTPLKMVDEARHGSCLSVHSSLLPLHCPPSPHLQICEYYNQE